MENKSLSQQICEICGIKPKYKYKRIPCEFFEGVVYVCKLKSSSDDEVICGDPSSCDDYIPSISHRYRHEEKPFYPDFENKNFAKLFKMITTLEDFSFSTGFYYIPNIPSYRQLSRLSTPDGEYASESTDPVKAFLTCVFKCAVKEKDTANFIKQQQWEV